MKDSVKVFVITNPGSRLWRPLSWLHKTLSARRVRQESIGGNTLEGDHGLDHHHHHHHHYHHQHESFAGVQGASWGSPGVPANPCQLTQVHPSSTEANRSTGINMLRTLWVMMVLMNWCLRRILWCFILFPCQPEGQFHGGNGVRVFQGGTRLATGERLQGASMIIMRLRLMMLMTKSIPVNSHI